MKEIYTVVNDNGGTIENKVESENFVTISADEIKRMNEYHYTRFPEDRRKKWAGCNYYINQGNNEYEPIGTAQSMHDCEGCQYYDICKIKKDTPIWLYNKEIGEELDILFNQMRSSVKETIQENKGDKVVE